MLTETAEFREAGVTFKQKDLVKLMTAIKLLCILSADVIALLYLSLLSTANKQAPALKYL